VADELLSIQKTWLAATAGAASALGIAQLVTAFDEVRTARSGEFDGYVGVVSKLSDGLKSAAISYSKADSAAATAYRKAGS